MDTYVDEICLAVKDIEAAKRFYEDVVGLKLASDNVILKDGPGVCRMATYRLRDLVINIVTPVGPQSIVLNRSMEKRGDGFQHFRFMVDNVEPIFERCRAAGIRLVNPHGELLKPGERVAYTDPRKTHRTVIEFVDKAASLDL